MPLLEARALRHAYGRHEVLRGCSFAVEEGEFVAIAGPNGAGKSTLFGLLTNYLKAAPESLFLFGKSATAWRPSDLAQKLAVVPQIDVAPPGMTALEMVLLGRTPFLSGFFRFESHSDVDIARDALRRTGMEAFAERIVTTLSGGERRLVALARALAQQPRVLLLDEPAASLDLHHQQALFRLLGDLNRNHGLTILTVTHDLNLAALYCSRLMLLCQGVFTADGPPAELLREEVLRPVYRADLWTAPGPHGIPVVGLLP